MKNYQTETEELISLFSRENQYLEEDRIDLIKEVLPIKRELINKITYHQIIIKDNIENFESLDPQLQNQVLKQTKRFNKLSQANYNKISATLDFFNKLVQYIVKNEQEEEARENIYDKKGKNISIKDKKIYIDDKI